MPIIANDYAYVCFRLCLSFPTKNTYFFFTINISLMQYFPKFGQASTHLRFLSYLCKEMSIKHETT